MSKNTIFPTAEVVLEKAGLGVEDEALKARYNRAVEMIQNGQRSATQEELEGILSVSGMLQVAGYKEASSYMLQYMNILAVNRGFDQISERMGAKDQTTGGGRGDR